MKNNPVRTEPIQYVRFNSIYRRHHGERAIFRAGGRKTCTRSAMVRLDRALPISYSLYMVFHKRRLFSFFHYSVN